MFAQGFAIKKELINGKPVREEGIMGEFNKQGARIIEVSDGTAKYTELSPQDIRTLISIQASPKDLVERLTVMAPRHHARRHHRTRRHHRRRGVAHGHTKRHKKRKTHKRKHKRKKRKTHKRTKRRRHKRK